ncbi:hypothetical protein FQZ97_743390 [compost metagenome]
MHQSRVGFHESTRHALGVGVALERLAATLNALDLIHPLRIAAGRLRGPRLGHAEAFQVHQVLDAVGPNARVHHGNVAAHAVAHQIDLALADVVIEQGVEVGQVVGEPVAVDCRSFEPGVAEAAPVGRDDPALGLQRVHHKLPRSRHIHPAMYQHQWRHGIAALTPCAHVVVQIADRDEFAA